MARQVSYESIGDALIFAKRSFDATKLSEHLLDDALCVLRRINVMNRTQQKSLIIWERKLDETLKTGKGPFKDLLVREIFDYLKIIKVIKNGKLCRAYLMAQDLDSSARDLIPAPIWNMLETAFYYAYRR